MMTALQTLKDNGLSNEALEALLNSIIADNSFENNDDKRCCIALLFDYERGDKDCPSDYSIGYGNIVDGPRGEYLVLDDDEADAVCKEYIEDSLWAFRPSFLASETGIDQTVFEALADKCEGANDAVRSIIDRTNGIDSFVESAIGVNGRGHFLNHYDGEENEIFVDGAKYYVYRQN